MTRLLHTIWAGLLLIGVTTQAQAETTAYTWPPAGLTITYPAAGWVVDVDATYFGVTDGELRIDFYPDSFLPIQPQSTRDILSLMTRNMRARGETPTSDGALFLRVGGFPAERINYTSDTYDGFYLAVEANDTFWLIDAYRQDRRMDGVSEDTVLAIIDTLQFLPAIERYNAGNFVLENYAFSRQLVIRELEQARIIPTGGTPIFEQDLAVGTLSQGGLIDDYFGADLVMGAFIAFDRLPQSGEPALCSLIGRASDESLTNNQGTFLLAALAEQNGAGSILSLEFDEADNSASSSRYGSGLDTTTTLHLLLVVQDGTKTVFANGRQLDTPQPLTITTDNQRSWAGYTLEPGCVMSNIWAHELP